jgi:hypothetical protein
MFTKHKVGKKRYFSSGRCFYLSVAACFEDISLQTSVKIEKEGVQLFERKKKKEKEGIQKHTSVVM